VRRCAPRCPLPLAYKVGLYTSVTPTYHPSVDGYVDGGVFAPNPSMCGLAQTQDPRTGEAVALSEVRLISMGTGTSLQYIEGAVHDWGYAQWAKPLISLLLDGVNGIADFQCRQILRESYHRQAPVFPPHVSIPPDGVDRLDYMVEFAESVDLTATVTWVRDQWNR
jgi:uncharacterized protein